MGSFFWSEGEGAWQRPFLFSLVHQLGVDTSHIIPVFFGDGDAPMKIPLIIPHINTKDLRPLLYIPFLSNN